ncbi:MAG: helix-turn-helix domain-containing protein [Ruminococcaceae bacterium]|nr:helix-turn-helix domain-containing protein [Oscillospiraceae bacterium]
MSFAENLKQLRKEKQLSQEELAEILDVSRQAVSKWEQGTGYPEVEKLLLLSSKLNISLDSLMETEIAQNSNTPKKNVTGTITITSPIERVIATCHKVVSSQKMSGGKSSPQYALFGKSEGNGFFGEEPTTFLGWYANETDISKEIMEIHDAIVNGIATYTLKYSVRTKKRLLGIKIESE